MKGLNLTNGSWRRFYFFVISITTLTQPINAEDETKNAWDLTRCIDYAMEQNIDIQKSSITEQESRLNTLQSKAQWQPSMSFSTSHTLNNTPWPESGESRNSYNGNYNIGASWTVFNGFKRKYNIKKQQLQEHIDSAATAETRENVKVSVLSDFIQILYATEDVKIRESSLLVAQSEYERNKVMFEVGSISKSDFAQIEAQLAKEKYQYITAKNALTEAKLELKLLLRLDGNEEMEILMPEITDDMLLEEIPSKETAYENALYFRPEIKSAKMNEDMSTMNVKTAKAGYFPSINLSASVGTRHNSAADLNIGNQMKHNFGENIGISLNYPILDNRNRKTEKQKSEMECNRSKLITAQTKDNLKKMIESTHNNATAALENYTAALANEKYLEESYKLTKEKYDLGAKTPFEMLSEKNGLLNAQEQTIQCKYSTIFNISLLKIYQGFSLDF